MISDILVAYRKKKGLNQTELAKAFGMSQGTVSLWERGAAVPSIEQLGMIARVLGITISELLDEEDQTLHPKTENSPATEAEKKLVQVFRELNKNNRDRALDYLALLKKNNEE